MASTIKNPSFNVGKYEALRDILNKMIDHRTIIVCSDELTESTRIELCENIDYKIEDVLNIFSKD